MTNYPMIIHLGLSCGIESHELNTLDILSQDTILQTEHPVVSLVHEIEFLNSILDG